MTARTVRTKAWRLADSVSDAYARHVSAAQGHRVLVGTPEYMADELEEWLLKGGADGFNVICNY